MESDQYGWLQINTNDYPARDRFPMFCEEMVRNIAALDIIGDDRTEFNGVLELGRAGPVSISSLSTSPAQYIRTPSMMRDGNDDIVVVLVANGSMRFAQGTDPQQFGTGQAVIGDNSEAGGLQTMADSRLWCMSISRPTLTGLAPHIERFAGLPLRNDGLALRLMSAYLNELRRVDLTTDDAAAKLAGEHLIDLVALALGARGEAGELIERRGLRAARRASVLRAIETRLANARLSAAGIASQFGITPRYVHMLFEDIGVTFSEYVLGKRLACAAQILRDPKCDHRKIADVAGDAGFSDLSHFNRSFRRRFGATPSEMRFSRPRAVTDN